MGWFEWLAQLAVAALLAGTIVVAARLEQALRAVRRDRETLAACAAGLDDASRRAQEVSALLREEVEAGCAVLERGMAAAGPVRDDLRYLVQRAEAAADRLEGSVRAARGVGGVGPAPTPPPAASPSRPTESRAERDLLAALARVAS